MPRRLFLCRLLLRLLLLVRVARHVAAAVGRVTAAVGVVIVVRWLLCWARRKRGKEQQRRQEGILEDGIHLRLLERE